MEWKYWQWQEGKCGETIWSVQCGISQNCSTWSWYKLTMCSNKHFAMIIINFFWSPARDHQTQKHKPKCHATCAHIMKFDTFNCPYLTNPKHNIAKNKCFYHHCILIGSYSDLFFEASLPSLFFGFNIFPTVPTSRNITVTTWPAK